MFKSAPGFKVGSVPRYYFNFFCRLSLFTRQIFKSLFHFVASLKLSDKDLCPFCDGNQKTDDHLMLLCQEKFNLNIWFRIPLTKLGCLKTLHSAIHGGVGNTTNKKKAQALIQAYITTVWNARSNNPTQHNVSVESS